LFRKTGQTLSNIQYFENLNYFCVKCILLYYPNPNPNPVFGNWLKINKDLGLRIRQGDSFNGEPFQIFIIYSINEELYKNENFVRTNAGAGGRTDMSNAYIARRIFMAGT